MKSGLNIFAILAFIVAGLSMVIPTGAACSQEVQFTGSTVIAGVPQPNIPAAAKGKQCIAPTDFMRRNHMNLLLHDRDQTVHFGDREIKASLKECIACHAVNGADNKPVTVDNPNHFCRVCHDYAAVKIDCFQCHASRPEFTLKGKLDQKSNIAQALASYVNGADNAKGAENTKKPYHVKGADE